MNQAAKRRIEDGKTRLYDLVNEDFLITQVRLGGVNPPIVTKVSYQEASSECDKLGVWQVCNTGVQLTPFGGNSTWFVHEESMVLSDETSTTPKVLLLDRSTPRTGGGYFEAYTQDGGYLGYNTDKETLIDKGIRKREEFSGCEVVPVKIAQALVDVGTGKLLTTIGGVRSGAERKPISVDKDPRNADWVKPKVMLYWWVVEFTTPESTEIQTQRFKAISKSDALGMAGRVLADDNATLVDAHKEPHTKS